MAMQGIGGNDAAFERQHSQRVHRTLGLVAAGRLARRQYHPRFRGKDIDHLQRSGALAPLVGAAQSLSVDGHDPCEVEPVGLGEGRHERPESFLESSRLQSMEHAPERVVAGNAVFQPQELPQNLFLRATEQRHVRRALGTAQHASQRDDQDLEQFVLRVGGSRIDQASEHLLEFLHRTPLAIRESPSESMLLAGTIPHTNPYAIPLHAAGRPLPEKRPWTMT
jgi:hypothetical protein